MKPFRHRQLVLLPCAAITMALVAGCGAAHLTLVPHASAHPTAEPGASGRHTPTHSSSKKASEKAKPGTEASGHVSSTATTKSPTNPLAGTYHPVKRPGKVAAERIPATRATFTSPVRYRDGLKITITKIAHGVESGRAPGDFYGRHDTLVTLRLTNGTPKTINLEQVIVQMAYGSPARLAPPVYDDSKTLDFAAPAKPGRSTTAVYAFAVPIAQRQAVTMWVDFDGLHAVAKFVGSVK